MTLASLSPQPRVFIFNEYRTSLRLQSGGYIGPMWHRPSVCRHFATLASAWQIAEGTTGSCLRQPNAALLPDRSPAKEPWQLHSRVGIPWLPNLLEPHRCRNSIGLGNRIDDRFKPLGRLQECVSASTASRTFPKSAHAGLRRCVAQGLKVYHKARDPNSPMKAVLTDFRAQCRYYLYTYGFLYKRV